MNSVLECQNLSKTFWDGQTRTDVVKNISLTVNAGELLAIVGPSGAGKSTLLHLLGGLENPSSGIVRVAGKDMQSLNERQKSALRNRYLGFVYQFHHLLPEFDALENVCMPLLIGGAAPKAARPKAEAILKKVGLSHRIHHRIGELSGGEKQRVAIARALVTQPVCVLADEPSGNLDRHTAEQIYQMIFELNKEFNTSFLIVTHDLELAHRMQRVVTLEDGQIVG